ncbi:N-terminal EF-hand calcium-binding protein 1 isoform X2 [Paramormyrops kingsleyae]|uniref:N-terminal EF-hand calcium-binding protein 1 isoform X2 n=1 Tax=Paramormyrops kingsleyae TaxID=1676925 RepID=UPI003B96C3BB
MDSSEEAQSLEHEVKATSELKKGMSIFLDILRRADKNDDGKLSFDEFKAYFSDGVLTGDDLKELFHTIDTHNTDNVDTDELCEYFSQHLGEYKHVLAALEDLNVSILKAMDKTKKEYLGSSRLEQFVTRFLLKETSSQLQSLQSSLECAVEATAEQMCPERHGPAKPEGLAIQCSGRRSNRRLQRNNSLSPITSFLSNANSGLYEEDNRWMTQINRLQKLIDRLETKELRLEPVEEEVSGGTTKPHILIVQRQLLVLEEEMEDFRLALRQYVESSGTQNGCLHIAVQKLADESRFTVYEFWECSSVWKNHLQANHSKIFQRCNVDFLESPEVVTTMLVPGTLPPVPYACSFPGEPRGRHHYAGSRYITACSVCMFLSWRAPRSSPLCWFPLHGGF